MREDKQLKKKCSMFETDGSWICGKSKLGWSSTITCLSSCNYTKSSIQTHEVGQKRTAKSLDPQCLYSPVISLLLIQCLFQTEVTHYHLVKLITSSEHYNNLLFQGTSQPLSRRNHLLLIVPRIVFTKLEDLL